MFKKTIYSNKVTINAPKEKVWQVLCDLEKYPEWNPFTYQVIGELALGKTVDLHVKMPIRGDRISYETVMCIDNDTTGENTLAWGMTMGSPLILTARRDQYLETINEQQCSYQTWDAFTGLLTPLVTGLFGKDMLNGFNAVGLALKEHCENQVKEA